MKLEIVCAEAVRALLPMSDCIDVMAQAMIATTQGTVAVPPRIIMPLIDNSGYFGVMPGSSSNPLVYGAKIVSLHPTNPPAGRPAVQGFVVLFDHHSGAPIALVDGAEITALRTAAASGLATRILASPRARTLGIFGCGAQASTHIEAICAVRDIMEVRIWGRSQAKAKVFAKQHASLTRANIIAVDEPDAVASCDVVCTVTGSHQPVIFGHWVKPGAHVNLVGAHSPTTREADSALIAKSRVYVDSLASAFHEAGDVLIPISEGSIDRSHVIGEIGALLLDRIPGRIHERDITLYKSVGHVAQDIVAAHTVYLRHKGRILSNMR